MVTVRPANERGVTRWDWLDSRHSFSFGEYHDPRHMSYRTLRVLNDDRIAPGGGFGMHPHRDMEILTVVLSGALEHRDSLGSGSVIRPGDAQRMSAGTGILHSEFNHSQTESLHLLQIWILPERRGLEPSYEEAHFPEAERRGQLRLMASRDGREGSLTLHQDVDVYNGLLSTGERATLPLRPGRGVWVQVGRGSVSVNGTSLEEGDAAIVEDEAAVELVAHADAEVLLFDLA